MRGAFMGRILGIAVVAVASLAGPAPGQGREEVMLGGSFEEGLGGWLPAVNDPSRVGAAIGTDPTHAKRGGKSLKIALPGACGGSITSPPAPVRAGEDYLLTFWYRSEGFSPTGNYAGVNLQYVLHWLDREKKPIATGGMGLSYGAVPQWRFMVRMFTPPPGTAFATLSFLMSVNETGRPSSFWLDGVSLRGWPGEPKPGGKTGIFHVADVKQKIAEREPWPAVSEIPRIEAVTKDMYFKTAGNLFQGIRDTTEYWLKQPKPYPNMGVYAESASWHAFFYHLTRREEYARTAAKCLQHAHRLIAEPQQDKRNTQPSWLTVVDLYFIERWLQKSPAYTGEHRKWIREIALKAVPSFPAEAVEYGAFNRALHGAITGEALLLLIPDAPDAAKWRAFKEKVWSYGWQFRDTDESTDHYNALWFRYLLQWVEMRGCEAEFWSDPGVKRLFERYLYQVFPMGAFPHYSDSCGWNVSWGHCSRCVSICGSAGARSTGSATWGRTAARTGSTRTSARGSRSAAWAAMPRSTRAGTTARAIC